ncbi:MAG: Na+/H+ antiporter NhaA [Chitinophagales bacterium]
MRPNLIITKPIQQFFNNQSSGGIVLIICTIAALVIANSGWGHAYESILHHHVEITLGEHFLSLDKAIHVWINDFLMAIFFFLIGLEIKREIMAGELSNIKAASLPIAAAIGGMVVPAVIYVIVNLKSGDVGGWAVPMATDIAFSLGILTLLGKKVPISLKIFLTGLAIVDDLAGVAVIALFFTSDININSLLIAAGIFVVLMLLNRFRVYRMTIYAILGLALWLFVYQSGIHPTIAGVLLAISIPARRRLKDTSLLLPKIELGTMLLKENPLTNDQLFLTENQIHGIDEIYKASKYATSPVQRLEHSLHPIVAFGIMPLFALANAGIVLDGNIIAALTSSVSLGIMSGLFLGKQLGITCFTWLAVKLKLGVLPDDVNWLQIWGLSCLAGIGFTMSLFISNLAFDDVHTITNSKIGILAGSLLSGLVGWIVLSIAAKKEKPL